jgi:hypothetical protein
MVIKLSFVVTLNALYRQMELSEGIMIEIMNNVWNIRFKTQGKCPNIAREVINNN